MSGMVSDKLRRHLQRVQEASATTLRTIPVRGLRPRKKFCKKWGQHLTKMRQIALFIGLPDGEVFLYHLTRDLTRDPTIHHQPPPPMRCCDAGKGYGSARQREWRRLLHVVYMCFCVPSDGGVMVRCVVRCWTNISPSETRMDKGFLAVLVRCQAFL